MSRRFLWTVLWISAAGLSSVSPGRTGEPKKPAGPAAHDLSLEVNALRALYYFQFTPDQLKQLQKLAKETAQPARKRQAKASDQYRDALAGLRDALADANDGDLINEREEQLGTIAENESPDLDDGVDVTDAARRRVPELLKQLKPSQVANYIAVISGAVSDPLEKLTDSLGKVRKLKRDEWAVQRFLVPYEVALLVAGLDADKADRVADHVLALLIKARYLTDGEFKKQRPELEKAAREIIGDVGPLDTIRHLVEHGLAELLSNPRLAEAVKARLKS